MSASARIVIRTKHAQTGKRSWVVATGKKTDPAGPYYIRTCEKAGSPRYAFAGNAYDVAIVARIKAERRLKTAEIGAVIPEEPSAPAPVKQDH